MATLRSKGGTDADRNGGNVMSIVAWLILGLIAGFIASKIVNKTGAGLILDIVLGIIGAIVGGFLFSYFGADPRCHPRHGSPAALNATTAPRCNAENGEQFILGG
jgi:uncharacterized membrane protein YeaQ/YmgE (transglycosylase-associated protein family)